MNWYKLGIYNSGLGVPPAVLVEIKNNTAYKSEEDKKEALLRYFLKNVCIVNNDDVFLIISSLSVCVLRV